MDQVKKNYKFAYAIFLSICYFFRYNNTTELLFES